MLFQGLHAKSDGPSYSREGNDFLILCFVKSKREILARIIGHLKNAFKVTRYGKNIVDKSCSATLIRGP